jgi:hypothetical protein
MEDQNSTPPPLNVELKFQMQAMTKMMERMNFVMGNMCDRLEKVGKHGKAGTCTQDVRKVGAESKSNHGSGAERPRWADYEDFEEDIDDIGDDGLKDFEESFSYKDSLFILCTTRKEDFRINSTFKSDFLIYLGLLNGDKSDSSIFRIFIFIIFFLVFGLLLLIWVNCKLTSYKST